MKLVELRKKSDNIQLAPKEALEEAGQSNFKADEVIIIFYNEENNNYEYWQGGSLSLERILWHLHKIEIGLLG
uniref:Uncharacterized protein n=1 Tax=viral metagenome TaxID=1070528 RepID=A0A6H1ZD17_9ZZZZ